MLATRVVRIDFPSTTESAQIQTGFVDFGGPLTVRNAHTALNGFDIRFYNGDHALLSLTIDCSGTPTWSGTRVDVKAEVLLRDNSGNIDDPYGGWVDVLVIADLR